MTLQDLSQKLIDTRFGWWLVQHRLLWDLLWGLSACAVALMAATWPTDRMRAIATGLALLWLIENRLLLRAIRAQLPQQFPRRPDDAAQRVVDAERKP